MGQPVKNGTQYKKYGLIPKKMLGHDNITEIRRFFNQWIKAKCNTNLWTLRILK